MMKSAHSETNKDNKKEEQVSTIHIWREYAEALGVALILAFIFKAFIIEAYSIPTGSMASTLMGRHKDLSCEVCGYEYQLGASREGEGKVRVYESIFQWLYNRWILWKKEEDHSTKIFSGTCPQCSFTTYVGDGNTMNEVYMSYNGDRIFVNKYLFDFRQPSRWHVTVFRYPANPYVNFIKRLVGVENETLQIHNGDIFVKRDGDIGFKIQRKPLRQLHAVLRPVADSDYEYAPIHRLGFPVRWQSGKNWTVSDDYKSFEFNSGADNEPGISWLQYSNITPSTSDWYELLNHKQLPSAEDSGKPMLITDFLAYNSGFLSHGGWVQKNLPSPVPFTKNGKEYQLQIPKQYGQGMGLNWVGDLALTCQLTVDDSKGKVTLRLIKGGVAFLCTLDLSSGEAAFSIPEVPEFKPFSVVSPLNKAGKYRIQFINVDEELRLVIDGKELDLQGKGCYDELCLLNGKLARDRSPTEEDLQPAAIGAEGVTSIKIDHLKIERDIYYIAADDVTNSRCDLIHSPFDAPGFSISNEYAIRAVLSSPAYWRDFGKTNTREFKLGKGQFLMLGDNSAESKDGRLWTTDGIPYYVDRKFLIGEAVFVYWGHGIRIPGTRIALIPNFPKMRWID